MKKIATLCLVFFFTLFTTGCPANDPYGVGAKAALDITDTIHTGATAVDQLRVDGTITKDEEKSALGYMNALNDADAAFGSCVKAAHTAGGKAAAVISCGSSFATAIQNPALLAEVHITNPKSQATVIGIGMAVQTLLTTALTQLQSLATKGA
jgi:hypothetical protein